MTMPPDAATGDNAYPTWAPHNTRLEYSIRDAHIRPAVVRCSVSLHGGPIYLVGLNISLLPAQLFLVLGTARVIGRLLVSRPKRGLRWLDWNGDTATHVDRLHDCSEHHSRTRDRTSVVARKGRMNMCETSLTT